MTKKKTFTLHIRLLYPYIDISNIMELWIEKVIYQITKSKQNKKKII